MWQKLYIPVESHILFGSLPAFPTYQISNRSLELKTVMNETISKILRKTITQLLNYQVSHKAACKTAPESQGLFNGFTNGPGT